MREQKDIQDFTDAEDTKGRVANAVLQLYEADEEFTAKDVEAMSQITRKQALEVIEALQNRGHAVKVGEGDYNRNIYRIDVTLEN